MILLFVFNKEYFGRSETPRIVCFVVSLYHMRLVWRAIGGAEESAGGGGRLLEAACATALHYADLVHGALADQGYYENHGQCSCRT